MKNYRTRDGREVVIYTENGKSKEYPIIGEFKAKEVWVSESWTKGGNAYPGNTNSHDLIEVSPYEDWPIDAKVLCWDYEGSEKYKRYFSGVDEKTGIPTAWINGRTSWTASEWDDKATWDYMKLAE
jgi:hypothetical protein